MYKTKIKLFNLINIGKIKNEPDKDVVYLFGIPVFAIKKYPHHINGHNNAWTREIYKKCKCGKNLWCGGPTRLTKHCELADNVSFNGCEVHGDGRVFFGKYFHSGVQLLIITRNHNYDTGQHIPYSPDDYIRKDVIIGDFVWVGSRVTILPGTKIGEGAIIQAGAVVHGEIPPCAIVGGNPAKVFMYRDKEHFYKLKEQGKFL